jgi:cytidylate kinase
MPADSPHNASSTPAPVVAPVVAIDGPAGAGKSTVARALARRLGFFLLDTGAIYRAVALSAQRAGISWGDDLALGRMARKLPLRFDAEGRLFIGAEDVSADIRTPDISQGASTVSAHPDVRDALLDLQRQLAEQGGCVVEGRDIGTVVLPWAPVKIFLTASPEVRAKRRYDELRHKGTQVSYEETLADMKERDHRDSTRAVAPLRQADDAVPLDTSQMTQDEVIDRLEGIARTALHLG